MAGSTLSPDPNMSFSLSVPLPTDDLPTGPSLTLPFSTVPSARMFGDLSVYVMGCLGVKLAETEEETQA